jgi:hypothetical protein
MAPTRDLERFRTNQWLADYLQELYLDHYTDVPIPNKLVVKFGRKSRSRFGSIIAKTEKSTGKLITYISINQLFRDPEVPDYVIGATLMHEFAHYAHGFHSPLPRKYTHPHRGGIVDKEIIKRGGEALLKDQEKWVKEVYRDFLKQRGML